MKLPAGAAGVKKPPVFGSPMKSATRTMKTRPPYFAITVTLLTFDAKRTPTTLNEAVSAIANAANQRTAMTLSGACGFWPVTRKKYSENVIAIAPRDAARIIENWPQPNRNPARRPQPSRQKTYMPPVSGSALATSASVSAPQSAKIPPAAHTASIGRGPGSLSAMPAGERKIPEPIVEPMTTATALQKPMRRARTGASRAEEPSGIRRCYVGTFSARARPRRRGNPRASRRRTARQHRDGFAHRRAAEDEPQPEERPGAHDRAARGLERVRGEAPDRADEEEDARQEERGRGIEREDARRGRPLAARDLAGRDGREKGKEDPERRRARA